MRRQSLLFSFLIVFISSLAFSAVFAATKVVKPQFDRAIWIPYWRKDEGASTTLLNLDKITQISPFAFELQTDGTIKNALKIEDEPWQTLITEARKNRIKIYPSILSYPKTMKERTIVYNLLSNKKKRQAHVKDIVSLIKKNNFDGIDIDYENKLAEIKPYFSLFLTELSTSLHKNKKQLICSIEPRTPPESRYATTSQEVLSKVEYANDYKVIGRVCDQVRIMAYDQADDDAVLTEQSKATPFVYKPVADIEWVKKVATIALWDMPAKKVVLGVATYGYKYEVIPATQTASTTFRRIGSMNFNYAADLAKSLHITPNRDKSGEVSYVYSTSTDIDGKPLGAVKEYLVWYSDATSIADKIRIAKLYKLGGVAVFKIDGGNDPNVWNVLK